MDLTDRRFGLLTALWYRASRKAWVCRCDCGEQTLATQIELVTGREACCDVERHPEMAPPPAKVRHPVEMRATYEAWRAMRRSGSEVAPRWQDFAAFLSDLDLRPSVRHKLTRLDTLRPWQPGNAGWRVAADRVRKRFTWQGMPMTLRAVCSFNHVPYGRVVARMKAGWTLEEAVYIPEHVRRRDDSERDDMAPDWQTYYARG